MFQTLEGATGKARSPIVLRFSFRTVHIALSAALYVINDDYLHLQISLLDKKGWNREHSNMYFTFNSAELVKRLEAGGVVDVVGVERDAEEVAVRVDGPSGKVVRRAAVARHLAVHQLNVEVGKLDEVALRSFVTAVQ